MTSPYLQRKPRSLSQAIRDLRASDCIGMGVAQELLLGAGSAVDGDGESCASIQNIVRYPNPRRKA